MMLRFLRDALRRGNRNGPDENVIMLVLSMFKENVMNVFVLLIAKSVLKDHGVVATKDMA